MNIETAAFSITPFRDINAGGCFLYGHDYYMRIQNKSHNAVRLKDGALLHFGDEEKVRPVQAKVVIL